jgi:hypothetical protein
MTTTIGDLGCPGVDLAKWKAANQIPIYPGKINTWVLVRTLRDAPDEDVLRTTLYAVFNKWFEGDPFDPAFSYFTENTEGGEAGPTDHIKILQSSSDPILLSPAVITRERMPGPMPSLNAEGGLLYLRVEFAYRGLKKSMPWPVRTAPGLVGVALKSSSECIWSVDWMLDEVGPAGAEAPKEVDIAEAAARKSGEILGRVISSTVVPAITGLLSGFSGPLLLAGLVGIVLLWRQRTPRGHP